MVLETKHRYNKAFHGGPLEENPVSEERSDSLKEEKEQCKFVYLKLLIIYIGSQRGRGVSWLKKNRVISYCMGIVINILLHTA
jgi:hypothetical protein